jgi:cyclase
LGVREWYDGALSRKVRIAKLKAEGKSRDEAIAVKPTADHDAKWGTGFMKGDAFTGLVYDSLPWRSRRGGSPAGMLG